MVVFKDCNAAISRSGKVQIGISWDNLALVISHSATMTKRSARRRCRCPDPAKKCLDALWSRPCKTEKE